MQTLYEKYKPDLAVLGFPCNQYGSQEPWDNAKIKKYVTETFNITFDMMAKVDIKGDDASPLWKLVREQLSGWYTWNFTKYLYDRNGNPVHRFAPTTAPIPSVEDAIKKLL